MTTCIAVVVAAGRGRRFDASRPKQYAALAGRPLVRLAIESLIGHPSVSDVLPVIHPDDRADFAGAIEGLDCLPPVTGGGTRQASVRNGLEALSERNPDTVLIHDAARPLIPGLVISRVLDSIAPGLGAVPALAIPDTVKRVDPLGAVVDNVPRETLVRVQTPQGFRFAEILAAHRGAAHLSLTDDAAVFAHAGHRVVTVPGSALGDKVTTAEDLARLGALATETRTGQGFDAHPFTDGAAVILCGVAIPHGRKLLGHSDADVALHAATDAVLGAIGAGDIGQHFPPTDAAYKDAPSATFLRRAMEILRRRGGELINLDITIICERPKIAPHRDAMAARTAEICGVGQSRVSVKATTTEGMGFTGRGEGVAAQAIATVRCPSLPTSPSNP
jgi:2-C-methyl-D-erythritol 4-phosphate cytidylyltransferase/2-C-methyl-D-erythritol 2,4-cyclodiphosphate synthase